MLYPKAFDRGGMDVAVSKLFYAGTQKLAIETVKISAARLQQMRAATIRSLQGRLDFLDGKSRRRAEITLRFLRGEIATVDASFKPDKR